MYETKICFGFQKFLLHMVPIWKSVVDQNQVGMDLIYHNSTCDIFVNIHVTCKQRFDLFDTRIKWPRRRSVCECVSPVTLNLLKNYRSFLLVTVETYQLPMKIGDADPLIIVLYSRLWKLSLRAKFEERKKLNQTNGSKGV